jgi:hypothetical protein
MTDREKWQTLNEVLTTLFMVAWLMDERYRWRDKLAERIRDRWRERRSERQRQLTEEFEEWEAKVQADAVAWLEELWERQ